MGFFWICPCGHENYYSGSKTTNVVVQCKSCKAKVKASSHKKPEIKVSIPERNYQAQPKTTDGKNERYGPIAHNCLKLRNKHH